MKFLIWGFLIVLQMVVIIKGQSNTAEYIIDSKIDARCELNNLYIEKLITNAIEKKERIFVISKLGKNEKFKINSLRLSYTLMVLTKIKKMEPELVITAIGDKTSEKNGKLEFYYGSKLFLVILIEPNKQVCLLCCGSS